MSLFACKPFQRTCLNLTTCLVALTLLMCILQLFQPELVLDRQAITHGQWWRIITGNLVHANWTHLGMNLAGLWLLWLLFGEHLSSGEFLISLLITVLAVGSGIYLFSPRLVWYAGFSGALYGLFIATAGKAFVNKDYLTSIPVLLAIPLKIIWDHFNPAMTDMSKELIGVPVATDSHLYGMAAGLLITIVLFIQARR